MRRTIDSISSGSTSAGAMSVHTTRRGFSSFVLAMLTMGDVSIISSSMMKAICFMGVMSILLSEQFLKGLATLFPSVVVVGTQHFSTLDRGCSEDA